MRVKHVLLVVALCCFSVTGMWAQNSTNPTANSQTPVLKQCRSSAGQAAIDYERKVDRNAYRQLLQYYLNNDEKGAIVEYAVQIHIVRRDNGTGGADINDIRDEFENFINPYFADIDIEFVECNPELYHNSTEYYTLGGDEDDPDLGDIEGDQMSVDFNVANVINIYYVGNADGACGWARFPWKLPSDYIVIDNSCADNQSTTVHELGHYFGLYHTHETFGGTAPESVTRDDTDGCWDCETDGDLLCDTPADPNLSSTAADFPSCAYTGTDTDDCNSDSYSPAIDNIMSYADKECRVIFSAEQKARMETFRDGDRSYLQTGCPCEKPEALCQNISVNLDSDGNASIDPEDVDNGSTYDCGLDSWSVSPNTFDCSDVGPNTVTLSITDDLGWESSCDATVTIVDNTKPDITTHASDMTVECDGSGNVSAFTDWLNDNGGAEADDACGGSWSNNSTGLSDGCGSTGSEEVTFTFTDPSGNFSTSTATFSIEDNTPPDLTCPADIHLPECVPTASWTVVSSDICGNVTVVSNPPSGSFFAKGTTTEVMVTSTDDCGNVSACSFFVTRDPDLEVDIDPLATSPLNTCAAGTGAHIVLGYGGGPTCLTMNAVGSGGHAPYTYEWDAPDEIPAGSFEDADTATPTFCADFQTEPCVTYTFVVTVTDIHGCTETNEIDVNVVNPLCTYGKNPKTSVCHRPPGNSSNEQTLCISSNATDNHLNNNAHDDCLGGCDDVCVEYSAKKPGAVTFRGKPGTDPLSMSVQPNPFSARTEIIFSSLHDTKARLVVIDVSGRIVATLFEGMVHKNTSYSVKFDSGDLRSGVYIARLIGKDGNSANNTVLIVK